jgi:predicted ATPase
LDALAREQALWQWSSLARVLRGWAAADANAGIADILGGLEDAQAVGSRIGAPFQVGMLAERQLAAGRFDDALQTVALALAVAEETRNHFRDPDLYRLRGDIEVARPGGNADEAASSFRCAIEIARAQGARGPELRAALSAARLEAERGNRNAARELLAPVYAAFGESLETAELRAAAALLAGL